MATDAVLAGQQLTPELIASSSMGLMQKISQDKKEEPVVDAQMEQKQDGEAQKRAAALPEERPAKESRKDGKDEEL